MKLTKITVTPAVNRGNLLAYVEVVLDHCFMVRKIKVINGNSGLHLQFPNSKKGEIWYDIAHPINQDTRKWMNDSIIAVYKGMKV